MNRFFKRLLLAGLVAGSVYIAGLRLSITEFISDVASNTEQEQSFERQTGIDIEGVPTRQAIEEFQIHLDSLEGKVANFSDYLQHLKHVALDTKNPFYTAKRVDGGVHELTGLLYLNNITSTLHELTHIKHHAMSEAKKQAFDKQWHDIADYNYAWKPANPDLASINGANYVWSNTKSTGHAQHGMLCPYGANSQEEDIATYVAQLFRHKENNSKIMIPSGDTRYEQKIKLLEKYDFVSEKESNEFKQIIQQGKEYARENSWNP